MDSNQKYALKMSVVKLKGLATNNSGNPIYIEEADKIFYDIFKVDNYVSKIRKASTDKQILIRVNRIGIKNFTSLMMQPYYYSRLCELVLLLRDIAKLKKTVRKLQKKGKSSKKERKQLEKLQEVYSKAIKLFRKKFKSPSGNPYKTKYKDLISFSKGNGKPKKHESYAFDEYTGEFTGFDDEEDEDDLETRAIINEFENYVRPDVYTDADLEYERDLIDRYGSTRPHLDLNEPVYMARPKKKARYGAPTRGRRFLDDEPYEDDDYYDDGTLSLGARFNDLFSDDEEDEDESNAFGMFDSPRATHSMRDPSYRRPKRSSRYEYHPEEQDEVMETILHNQKEIQKDNNELKRMISVIGDSVQSLINDLPDHSKRNMAVNAERFLEAFEKVISPETSERMEQIAEQATKPRATAVPKAQPKRREEVTQSDRYKILDRAVNTMDDINEFMDFAYDFFDVWNDTIEDKLIGLWESIHGEVDVYDEEDEDEEDDEFDIMLASDKRTFMNWVKAQYPNSYSQKTAMEASQMWDTYHQDDNSPTYTVEDDDSYIDENGERVEFDNEFFDCSEVDFMEKISMFDPIVKFNFENMYRQYQRLHPYTGGPAKIQETVVANPPKATEDLVTEYNQISTAKSPEEPIDVTLVGEVTTVESDLEVPAPNEPS